MKKVSLEKVNGNRSLLIRIGFQDPIEAVVDIAALRILLDDPCTAGFVQYDDTLTEAEIKADKRAYMTKYLLRETRLTKDQLDALPYKLIEKFYHEEKETNR